MHLQDNKLSQSTKKLHQNLHSHCMNLKCRMYKRFTSGSQNVSGLTSNLMSLHIGFCPNDLILFDFINFFGVGGSGGWMDGDANDILFI